MPRLTVVLFVLAACGPQVVPAFGPSGTVDTVQFVPPPPPPAPPPPMPAPIWGVSTLVDTNPDPKIVEVSLTAEETMITLSPTKTVAMYTYNGIFPGPLLEATVGDRVIVHFTNHLKEPTTIHWHGLRISDQMDGNPRIQTPVPPEGTFTYDFVVPDSGSFWYHPHVRANEQIEKGLYGPIAVRSADEPIFDADRYLVLDDVLLTGGTFVPFLANHMEGMMGRYGNYLLINGQITSNDFQGTAKLGSWERWRLVNTANARTMELEITGASFRVIGTDGGLLKTPFTTRRLELPVGQRYELEVHYDKPGEAVLTSYVLASTSSGGVTEVPKVLMRVTVDPEVATSTAPVYVVKARESRTVGTAYELAFDAVNDPVMGLMWRINGQSHSTTMLFTAAKGDAVLLRLNNLVDMEHPFHIHGQFFDVMNEPLQVGLKDVVLVPGNTTVQIIAYLDNPGEWMAHCHILEHSELGMMAEFKVTP